MLAGQSHGWVGVRLQCEVVRVHECPHPRVFTCVPIPRPFRSVRTKRLSKVHRLFPVHLGLETHLRGVYDRLLCVVCLPFHLEFDFGGRGRDCHPRLD